MVKVVSQRSKIVIYKSKNGQSNLDVTFDGDTVWLSQDKIAKLFAIQRPAITKHLKNIFESGELIERSVSSILEHTANDNKKYKTKFYNLDAIISVGYRINSKEATFFRQWATKTLKQHLLDGYTLNQKIINKNHLKFLEAIDNVKRFLPSSTEIKTGSVLELIKAFASTWFSIDSYDKSILPRSGNVKKSLLITTNDLNSALKELKEELIKKGEASELFGQDKQKDSIKGIVGNVFQSFGGKDVYPTLEEKASHLLYFIVKNHPFNDGNKRSGAFAFIWFLQKAKMLNVSKISPEALTSLTLLVAESNPKDKDKIIGLILMLL